MATETMTFRERPETIAEVKETARVYLALSNDDRIKALDDRDAWKKVADDAHVELVRLRFEAKAQAQRIAQLEVALAFYADPANWTEPGQVNAQELFDTAMGADLGALARAALKQD